MSKASDIHTALNSLIETTLPGYVKLPDYDHTDNAVINLEKGYRVGISSAVNDTDIVCQGNIRIQRTFTIALTNVYVANLDPNYREGLERDLMDDAFTLIQQIECNPTLGGVSVNSSYSDDGGIEYLNTDDKQFIAIFLNVVVDYFE